MPNITHVILSQGYEIVRDRVAIILTDEIERQAILSYDAYLDLVEVKVEQSNPVDKIEIPTINVSFASNSFSNKNAGGSEDGLITIYVDVYTSAKTSLSLVPGDKIASIRCQKLLGLCRYILSDPIYKTLGLLAPSISRVYSGEINIKQVAPDDAINQTMGRYTFYVLCNESNKLIVPNLIAGYQTTVNLDNTTLGYFYEGS